MGRKSNKKSKGRQGASKKSKNNKTFVIYDEGFLKNVSVQDYVDVVERKENDRKTVSDILDLTTAEERRRISRGRARFSFARVPAFQTIMDLLMEESIDTDVDSLHEDKMIIEINVLRQLHEEREKQASSESVVLGEVNGGNGQPEGGRQVGPGGVAIGDAMNNGNGQPEGRQQVSPGGVAIGDEVDNENDQTECRKQVSPGGVAIGDEMNGGNGQTEGRKQVSSGGVAIGDEVNDGNGQTEGRKQVSPESVAIGDEVNGGNGQTAGRKQVSPENVAIGDEVNGGNGQTAGRKQVSSESVVTGEDLTGGNGQTKGVAPSGNINGDFNKQGFENNVHAETGNHISDVKNKDFEKNLPAETGFNVRSNEDKEMKEDIIEVPCGCGDTFTDAKTIEEEGAAIQAVDMHLLQNTGDSCETPTDNIINTRSLNQDKMETPFEAGDMIREPKVKKRTLRKRLLSFLRSLCKCRKPNMSEN